MAQANRYEAKANLSRLVECATADKESVIAKGGCVPARPPAPREFGFLAGRVRIGLDFDAPLPDDVRHVFDGKGS